MNCASVVSVVTVGKHHHTENTVWMIWAVGGFSQAVEFVIWCANKKCAANICRVKCHTESLRIFGGVYLRLSHNDFPGWSQIIMTLTSSCVWSTDERWRRGVRSSASQNIKKCATHTQLCWWGEPSTDTTAPIWMDTAWRLWGGSPGVQCENAINLCYSSHLFWGKLFFFLTLLNKLMKRQKDGACDRASTWLETQGDPLTGQPESQRRNGSSGAALVRFWACSWHKDCSWAPQVYWRHLVNVSWIRLYQILLTVHMASCWISSLGGFVSMCSAYKASQYDLLEAGFLGTRYCCTRKIRSFSVFNVTMNIAVEMVRSSWQELLKEKNKKHKTLAVGVSW